LIYFYKLYIAFALGVTAACVGACYGMMQTNADYKPENLPIRDQETSDNSSIFELENRIYLDFSPSMEGFFRGNVNGTMDALVGALRNLNENSQNQHFYWCADQIVPVSAPYQFYMSMQDEEAIENYYHDLLDSVESSDWQVNEIGEENARERDNGDEFKNILSRINLSDLFTSRYSDNQAYTVDEKSLNIIISDMNFRMEEGTQGVERQESRMDEFASRLSDKTSGSNVCIYNLYSDFYGSITDEFDLESDDNNQNRGRRSFFVIIIASNDSIYEQCINALESQFLREKIDCSDKFELKKNPLNGLDNLQIDFNRYKGKNWIDRQNLNCDNQSFIGLNDNAIGLRLVTGQGITASLDMPLAVLELPGYRNSVDAADDDTTEIELETKVFYPHGGGYKEYDENRIVRYSQAGLKLLENEWYLTTQMELDTTLHPSFPFVRRCLQKQPYYVIDLRFFLNKPSYSIPQWIDSAEEAGMGSVGNVFQTLISRKEKEFQCELPR
jgi:hypothetical protein